MIEQKRVVDAATLAVAEYHLNIHKHRDLVTDSRFAHHNVAHQARDVLVVDSEK